MEIPIGAYESGGRVGSFTTVIEGFDVPAIHTVKIPFSLKIRKTVTELSTLVSGDEARRLIGRKH